MKNGFIRMSSGEQEAFDWTKMVAEETECYLSSPGIGDSGLINPMISVPEEVAERELVASAVRESILNGDRVLTHGFVKDGRKKYINATTGQRWEVPVSGHLPIVSQSQGGQAEAKKEAELTNEQKLTIRNRKEEQSIPETGMKTVKQEHLPEPERLPDSFVATERLLPMTAENQRSQREAEKAEPVRVNEVAFQPGEDELLIPGTGVRLKLVEKQEHFCRDGSESVFAYVFEVCSIASRKRVVVSGEKLQQLAWLVSATGGLLYLTAKLEEQIKKSLILLIQSSGLKAMAYYEVNGWTYTAHGYAYVLHNGIIGDPECGVRGNPKYIFPGIIGESSSTIFLEVLGMLQICRNTKIMWALMLYVQATFLATLFEIAGMPLKTILALIGETNSRKTTLAILIGKVFNRMKLMPDITFTATTGGIEKMIYEFHDSCLILDDMKPGATKGQNRDINQKLEQVTRLYGDRTPKKRMTGLGSDEELRINGGCIVTGEYIEGVESSRARRLEVTIDREEVNNGKLSQYQKRDVWPTYLYHFLAFVTARFDAIVGYIRSRVEELRRSAGFKLGRRNEIWAQLTVVMEIMMFYGVECGAISQERSQELLKEGVNAVYEILRQNEKEAKRVSHVCLVLRALNGYVQENGEAEMIFGRDTKKVYVNERYYFVALPRLIEIAVDYSRRTAADTPLPGERILPKLLEDEGVLEIRMEGGQKRRTHHLPGYTAGPRFLWIRKDKFAEFIEKNGVE